jgi:hypothetical protein
MPTMSVGRHFEECVNAPGAPDDTYITDDVRDDVLHAFRASPVPAEWGIGGYSSGGYCAANLALRHPGDFGAAGVMDGYFRPSDGPAAAALHDNPAAEAANDPLLAAQRLRFGAHPLPSFWLSAGTGDAADYAAAEAFTTALHDIESVTLYREPGVGHNFYAWRPSIPRMLAWMWSQIAPPQLRVQFPIAGGVTNSTIRARLHPPSPGRSSGCGPGVTGATAGASWHQPAGTASPRGRRTAATTGRSAAGSRSTSPAADRPASRSDRSCDGGRSGARGR